MLLSVSKGEGSVCVVSTLSHLGSVHSGLWSFFWLHLFCKLLDNFVSLRYFVINVRKVRRKGR